jgi:hypothetical protein
VTEPLEAWDDLTARIYADTDFSPGGREVALALGWVIHRDPGKGGWRKAAEILGADRVYRDRPRIWQALAEDIPFYDPGNYHYYGGSCEGPRLRAYKPRRDASSDRCLVSDHHPHLGDCRYPVVHGDLSSFLGIERDQSVCGAHATVSVTEYDPVTGWERLRWFCSRHKERAREVQAQLRAALPNPPPPIPNRGGVLPRYFKTDWEATYAMAVKQGSHLPGVPYMWEPPYYGVCRDDWPVPGKTAIPRKPRLTVVS